MLEYYLQRLDSSVDRSKVSAKLTIFHDAGYGVLEDSKRHAESGAVICRNYLQDHVILHQNIFEIFRKYLSPT